MAKKKRRQDTRGSVSPPVVAPTPPSRPKVAAAKNIPVDPADEKEPSKSPPISKSERCKRILVAVREMCVERILDLTILSGKVCSGLRRGLDLVNMVTYNALIVSTQLWLSAAILENLLHLMIVSGIRFQFPLESFSAFLVKGKKYLASDFRLLVLSCVCISFTNDLFTSNLSLPPVERMKIHWNVFFAQIIMYSFLPFMQNIADIVNVILAILSFGRLAVEIGAGEIEDAVSSMNFLPKALLYHLLFFSIMGTYFTYYEASKLIDKYWGVAPPPPIQKDQ